MAAALVEIYRYPFFSRLLMILLHSILFSPVSLLRSDSRANDSIVGGEAAITEVGFRTFSVIYIRDIYLIEILSYTLTDGTYHARSR